MKAHERFLKYVAYPTMSNEESTTSPSTEKQLALASALCDELLALGVNDARVDEYGYVYGTLPSNVERDVPAIGLIAHMDTSPDASDENVKARIVEYDGGDILLNEEKSIVMSVEDYPYLEKYKGQHLIVTDGTTLLGADDKAGIAEIMTAVEEIVKRGLPHGKICIGFTPDEEIGRGADNFNVKEFGAAYAYTVDGGALGGLEYENFNAASAIVKVAGRSIHPGSAKDKMKNASKIGMEFDSLLPPLEVPEHTEGYEGFHHLIGMEGECEGATLVYIIRDHDRAKFEAKKALFLEVAKKVNEKYGDGTVSVKLTDSYYNMRERIEDGNMYVVERALTAMRDVGVVPEVTPIRGGTDGARLSFMGLPCPNLCTGGENFHSRFEFVALESMDKIVEILLKIVENSIK